MKEERLLPQITLRISHASYDMFVLLQRILLHAHKTTKLMQFKNKLFFLKKERYFGSLVLWPSCDKLLQLTHDWQPVLVSSSHRGETGQRAEGAELFALGRSSRCGEEGNADSFNVKLQPLFPKVRRVGFLCQGPA